MYFYIMWISGDSSHDFKWFEIHPSKSKAMTAARLLSRENGKEVVYISHASHRRLSNYDSAKHIVIEQRTEYYYYGA